MAEYVSIKEDVLQKLETHLPEIRDRFGIETLGIFGSVSRGEDTPESDVDVLYRFQNGSAPLKKYIAFYEYLQELFGRDVEIISLDYIEPCIRPAIEKEMILYPPEATV